MHSGGSRASGRKMGAMSLEHGMSNRSSVGLSVEDARRGSLGQIAAHTQLTDPMCRVARALGMQFIHGPGQIRRCVQK